MFINIAVLVCKSGIKIRKFGKTWENNSFGGVSGKCKENQGKIKKPMNN